MKVALLSYVYAPSLGGIESASRLVADGLSDRGHDVRVITTTPGRSDDESRVTRRPSPPSLLRALNSADVVLQSNVSLALSWPLLAGLVQRRWVVVNHTPIARPDGRRALRDSLKIATLPRNAYSVSRFLQSLTPVETRIMPNPYDDRVFGADLNRVRRDPRHLLFVGRLVPVKGLDLLLEALGILSRDDPMWRLTVVGDGSGRQGLVELSERLGIASRVDFVGKRFGRELAKTMAEFRIVVMPSREQPAEAYGMVALEAVASGCVVVASSVGGLPEAVGHCGVLVPPEDVPALTAALRDLTADAQKLTAIANADSPTATHTISAVAEAYERAISCEYR